MLCSFKYMINSLGFVRVFSVPIILIQFSPASMDPLTTTLAVISLATAVKDLVELAQNISDAFAKVRIYSLTLKICGVNDNIFVSELSPMDAVLQQVPQNYKKANNLASDILRTSKQIQTLYSNKKDIFESMDDLKASLQELKR